MGLRRLDQIKSFIKKEDLKNINIEDSILLPTRILEMVGTINSITYPQQGYCSLVLSLETKDGKFLVKIAKGDYRCDELKAEFKAMNYLKDILPVPKVIDFFKEKEFAYLVREYTEGNPLNVLFQKNKDKNERRPMIIEMAKLLAGIHQVKMGDVDYKDYIDATLHFASSNLKNDTIDNEDLYFDEQYEDPKEVYQYILNKKPTNGKVCLIHGDFRPKNILWENGSITSIIDWAFVDIGDPYYDLAVFMDYLLDDDEKTLFLKNYGLNKIDQERLSYFKRLVPFINI